jgi:CBS domain-containing protein
MGDAPAGLTPRVPAVRSDPGAPLLIAASVFVVVALFISLLRLLYRKRCLRIRALKAPATDAQHQQLTPAILAAEAAAVPLIMLVNVRSGGGKGVDLLSACQKVPHPPEAFALSREGLVDAVRRLSSLRAGGLQPRVVCAGGDGTVTAVVRTLLERGLTGVPVAVLPLGTGNDCARTLGSTAPLFDPESMARWLRAARTGRCVQADVFSVAFDVWPGGSILSVRDKTETQLAGVLI